MNQTFNFQRFLLLMKVEWAEKGRIQVLTAGLLLAFLLMFMLPVVFFDDIRGLMAFLQVLTVFMVVLFGGSLYTNIAFGQYGPGDKSMTALMVPASRLEKFLTPLVLNLIFLVPFMLLFLWLQSWTVDYANAKLPASDRLYGKIPLVVLQVIVLSYIVIQGVVFLGSLYFNKSSYVKTVTVFVLIILAFMLANWAIVNSLLADDSHTSIVAFPFTSWDIHYYKPMYKSFHVQYSDGAQNLTYLLPILITISLWYLTYVRLKEKEI